MLNDQWQKPSRSGPAGECMSVCYRDGRVLVRDDKVPNGPVLSYTPGEWLAARDAMRSGEFDLPPNA